MADARSRWFARTRRWKYVLRQKAPLGDDEVPDKEAWRNVYAADGNVEVAMRLKSNHVQLENTRRRIVHVENAQRANVVKVLFDDVSCRHEDAAVTADEEGGPENVCIDLDAVPRSLPRTDWVHRWMCCRAERGRTWLNKITHRLRMPCSYEACDERRTRGRVILHLERCSTVV